jgi:hypothetical protein
MRSDRADCIYDYPGFLYDYPDCQFYLNTFIFGGAIMQYMRNALIIVSIVIFYSCNGQMKRIETGASQTSRYIPMLEGKNIAIVANQTTMVNVTSWIPCLP